MRPVDTYARTLGGLLFVAANLIGLSFLWAIGPQYLEAGTLFVIAANLAVMVKATGRDRDLLLSLLFAIVFALFHFSLLPIAVFDPQLLIVHHYFSLWYFEPFTKPAFWISLIFFICTVGGALAGKRLAFPVATRPSANSHEARSDILLLIFAGLVVYFFVAVFLLLGVSNYTEYNELARTENASLVAFSLVLLYPAIAACGMLCAVRARSLKLFLILFAAWAIPAFATGLRGAVLFPTALMLPLVLSRLQLRFRPIPAFATSLGLLWIISFGRLVRGSGNWTEAVEGASPIDALAELGGSIRPVFEAVRWTKSGILDFFWGGTYWAPIERVFQKVMPFTDPIPASLDGRLMNVTIVKLTGGAYGFSIAAEAYINFGYAGAAVVGLLSGYLLARIGRQFTIGHVGFLSAALAYALFYHIRQSYVGAWGSFIVVAAFTRILLKIDLVAREFLHPARPSADWVNVPVKGHDEAW